MAGADAGGAGGAGATAPKTLHELAVALLERLALASAGDVVEVTPLAGGVASDIARVTLGRPARLADGGDGPTRLCVKFALERLRVAADWRAPLHRNAAEYRWLALAARVLSGQAPRLYGRVDALHGFAMEWIDGARSYPWKTALLEGRSRGEEAAAVADALGRVQAASTRAGFDAEGFDNADDFHALRVEPYLLHAARAHPALASSLERLAADLDAARTALVHGDVSPKNVLVRDGVPLLLDAECATLGDPAFDVAFCVNHLLIKALHLPDSRAALLAAAGRFVAAHRARVCWEDADALDARVAALVPALALARVDGKSPVEYLDEGERERLRALTVPLVARPPASTRALFAGIDRALAAHPRHRDARRSLLPRKRTPNRHRRPTPRMPSPDSIVKSVRARRVWDSRARPTVEVEIACAGGATGRAIAPAGASRGSREALELRDGGERLGGLDVRAALANVERRVGPALLGMDATDQEAIDAALVALDPDPLKGAIGANATVATSLAALHAAAASRGLPTWRHLAERHDRVPSLPLPEVQIFGGGAHAGRRVDVQDFMVMVPGATSFAEALELTAEVYHAAGALMKARGRLAGVADEGGWWPLFDSNEEALETLCEAILRTGETPGGRVVLSLDVAASEFREGDGYRLALEDRLLSGEEMIALLGRWIDDYAVRSIEDPLAEDDVAGMRAFTAAQGNRVQVVGDDYVVTNAELIERAARDGACNAALIKVNQVGTVSEAIAALEAAERAGWRAIVSARSGESEDTSIVDLAVGLGVGQLKVGSIARTERTAKWNACLRVEEALGADAFVGAAPLGRL